MTELGIIADDLTGSMDTGVQCAKRGLHTVVMLHEGRLPKADAVVISTDSRNGPPEEAYRRAKWAALQLKGRALYKKVDSTLRGHLGPELDGVLDGLGLELALVVPAFPAAGRTTVGGIHFVHGVPLSETTFAHDSLWPMMESRLPALLSRQTQRRVVHLPLETVMKGPQAVKRALEANPCSIVTADAVESMHLRTLALALVELDEPCLPCGSAGLAEGWLSALGLEALGQSAGWPADERPVLVVAGSRHPTTARQLKHAFELGCLELLSLQLGDSCEKETLASAERQLGAGRNVALSTTFAEHWTGAEETTARMLAKATSSLLARLPVSGLILTGGDTARAVCCELGANALQIVDEVQAGVPAGMLLGGAHAGLRVVTKAGGLGNDEAISASIRHIRGGRHER